MNMPEIKCYEIKKESYPQNSQHITTSNNTFFFFKIYK